jgi:hypothetical protein
MKKGLFMGLILLASTSLLLLGFANAKGNGAQVRDASATQSTVFIHNLTEADGTTSITADAIQWYEGEEANKQFREHEGDMDMLEAPDGYYIVDDSSDLESLKIAADAEILMQIYDRPGEKSVFSANQSITLKQLIALFNQKDGLDMRDYPFHLTIQHGEVVKLVQQYVS